MKRFLLLAILIPTVALAQDAPKEDPAKKPDKKIEEPKKEMPPAEDDVQKTAERIATNAQKAGDRLKEKDVSNATRKIQEDILKDIDALLRKAQQPPPPMPPMMMDMMPMMPPPPMKSDMPMMNMGMGGGMPMPKNMSGMGMGSPPPPKGGMSGMGSSQPQGGNPQGSSGRRPRKDRKSEGDPMPMPMGMGMKMGPMGMMPMGMDPPTPAKIDPKEGMGAKKENMGDGPDNFGKNSPRRKDDNKFADLYKDVWGTLPDRLRQEMDLYYREQFMPRYSELLRQYYAAIAEQKKKGDGDR